MSTQLRLCEKYDDDEASDGDDDDDNGDGVGDDMFLQTLTHPVEGGIPTTRWAPMALQVETMTTTKMTMIIMIQDTRDTGCDKSLVQIVMTIMVMFMMMNGSTVQPSCDKCQKLGDDRDMMALFPPLSVLD